MAIEVAQLVIGFMERKIQIANQQYTASPIDARKACNIRLPSGAAYYHTCSSTHYNTVGCLEKGEIKQKNGQIDIESNVSRSI